MRAIAAFRWWYLCFFAAGLALLASFYLDPQALAWIAQHQNAGARSFLRAVSKFGDWPEHIALGFILLGLAWWRGSKRWMQDRHGDDSRLRAGRRGRARGQNIHGPAATGGGNGNKRDVERPQFEGALQRVPVRTYRGVHRIFRDARFG